MAEVSNELSFLFGTQENLKNAIGSLSPNTVIFTPIDENATSVTDAVADVYITQQDPDSGELKLYKVNSGVNWEEIKDKAFKFSNRENKEYLSITKNGDEYIFSIEE